MTKQQRAYAPLGGPLYMNEARQLADIWKNTVDTEIMKLMQVSATKAAEVAGMYAEWTASGGVPAIDAFRGDIYSGLQAGSWTENDRAYAHEHLIILSGLYGALRACDGIRPYRLEMGYKLPGGKTMYGFWGDKLVRAIAPGTMQLINLSAVEYTKALLPYVSQEVITPKFLTIHPKTGAPVFVTVHAKIARGAFARWLIQGRINEPRALQQFTELGYRYEPGLSAPERPVFVCKTFKGIGLSVRQTALQRSIL